MVPLDETISLVEHESVGTVLRQCDDDVRSSAAGTARTISSCASHVHSVRNVSRHQPKERHFNRMTRAQIAHAKITSRSTWCGNYMHSFCDHRDDGSLSKDTPSSPTPTVDDKLKSKDDSMSKCDGQNKGEKRLPNLTMLLLQEVR